MLELKQSGPPAGDRTIPYNVILDGEYTVERFIDAVKALDSEWFGSIEFDNGTEIGSPRNMYGVGGILLEEGMQEEDLNKRVRKARARGGAIEHHMNYFLQVGEK